MLVFAQPNAPVPSIHRPLTSYRFLISGPPMCKTGSSGPMLSNLRLSSITVYPLPPTLEGSEIQTETLVTEFPTTRPLGARTVVKFFWPQCHTASFAFPTVYCLGSFATLVQNADSCRVLFWFTPQSVSCPVPTPRPSLVVCCIPIAFNCPHFSCGPLLALLGLTASQSSRPNTPSSPSQGFFGGLWGGGINCL